MKITLFFSLLYVIYPTFARDLKTIQQSGVVKVAVDGETPGFNFFKGKELTGFEVDLAKEMATGLKVKVEWVVQPFNTLLVGLGQDRFDLIATSHAITAEREKVADFVKPHYCTGAMMVSKKGGITTETALKGKSVAVPVGTVYYDYLSKNKTLKQLKTFPNENTALQDLLAGKSDVWVSDQMVAYEAIKAHPDLQEGAVLFSQRNAMVVMKGNDSLKKAIDQQLQNLLTNGGYAKLSQQYFQRDIRCKAK